MRAVRSSPVLSTTSRGAAASPTSLIVSRGTPSPISTSGHRDPLDEGAERVGQERIALVAAVVAHLPTEETGRHAGPDLLGLAFAHSVH